MGFHFSHTFCFSLSGLLNFFRNTNTMSFVVSFPDNLLAEIIVSWLTHDEVAKFDSSLCNGCFRRSYLSLSSNVGFTIKQVENIVDPNTDDTELASNWFMWTLKRGFRVDGITFDEANWMKWQNEVEERNTTELITSFDRCTHLTFSYCFASVSLDLHAQSMMLLLNSCTQLKSVEVYSTKYLNFSQIVKNVDPQVFANLTKLIIMNEEETLSSAFSPPRPIVSLCSIWCQNLVEVGISCRNCLPATLDTMLLGNTQSLKTIQLFSLNLTITNCFSLLACNKLTIIRLQTAVTFNESILQKCVEILCTCKELTYFALSNLTEQGDDAILMHCCKVSKESSVFKPSPLWMMEFKDSVSSVLLNMCLAHIGERLQFLSLHCARSFDDSISQNAAMYNPNLVLIKFVSCVSLDVEQLILFIRLPGVRVVTLNNCTLLSPACILRACLKNTMLSTVSIVNHQHLNLVDVHQMFEQHSGITQMRCETCSLISKETSVCFRRIKDSNHLDLEYESADKMHNMLW
jgi:hypothetical protein